MRISILTDLAAAFPCVESVGTASVGTADLGVANFAIA